MKTPFIAIALLMSGQALAERQYLEKVFSRYNETGTYMLTCKFFDKKVEITEFTGDASSLRVEPTSFSGDYLDGLINQASWRDLTAKKFNICDGGSLAVKGFTSDGTQFILKHYEDCGPAIAVRQGAAAKKLRSIVSTYCPSDEFGGGGKE